MTINEATVRLQALGLHGMAQAWQELQAQSSRQQMSISVWLERLLDAEQADRNAKRLKYQLSSARFPTHRGRLGRGFRPCSEWSRHRRRRDPRR